MTFAHVLVPDPSLGAQLLDAFPLAVAAFLFPLGYFAAKRALGRLKVRGGEQI